MQARILFLLAFISFTGKIFGQKVAPQNGPAVELTQTDIARLDNFDAKSATVFGIGLKMNMTKVRSIVGKQKNLKLEADPMSSRRLYLYDLSGDSGRVLLGYLKWLPNDSGLNQIVLYESITPYLKGLSCSILSKSCLDPESEVYKNFLGAPADQDIVLDVPSIGLKTVRYYYPGLALMIEMQQEGEKTKYNLILYGFKG
jgi:hypothetical protein